MKKLIHFVGIDVSKETFDLALIKDNDMSQITQKIFLNNVMGFKELHSWLKQQKVDYPESLFCM